MTTTSPSTTTTTSLPRRRSSLYGRLTIAAATVLVLTAGAVVATAASSETTNSSSTTSKLGSAAQFVFDFLFNKHSLSYSGERKGLQVIGAGFGRTGTKSIERALVSQGHRVYDLRSMFEQSHTRKWVQAAEDWKYRNDLTLISTLLEEMESKGYTATLDFPMNLFALAFAELRPEAKVLFSVRDTEEKWSNSWKTVVGTLSHFICRPWKWFIGDFTFPPDILHVLEPSVEWKMATYPEHIARPLPWFEYVFYHPAFEHEKAMQWIDMHKSFQKRLEETLPADRLLIYNVKQGWKPLIPFLNIEDKSLADEEFPNINDFRSLQIVRQVMDVMAISLPFWFGLMLYGVYRVFCRPSNKALKSLKVA